MQQQMQTRTRLHTRNRVQSRTRQHMQNRVQNRIQQYAGRKVSGYLTVYLTLLLGALLSLALVLIDGVRRSTVRLETQCATQTAMDSLMAEYHQDLFRRYHLTAIDCSYQSEAAQMVQPNGSQTSHTNQADPINGMNLINEHLRRYLEGNLHGDKPSYGRNPIETDAGSRISDWIPTRDFLGITVEKTKVTNVSYLTSDGGLVFRKLAVDAIKDDCGLETISQVKEWITTIESNDMEGQNLDEDLAEARRQLWEHDGEEIYVEDDSVCETAEEGALPKTLPDAGEQKKEQEHASEKSAAKKRIPRGHTETVHIEDPSENWYNNPRPGLLRLVTDAETLSEKVLAPQIFSSGSLDAKTAGDPDTVEDAGTLTKDEGNFAADLTEAVMFREYLMKYMTAYPNATSDETAADRALDYQLEYLIAGKQTDVDNLKSVTNRLLTIREAANVMYLYSNKAKCAEAELMAIAISAVTLLPELKEVFKTVIILGWAGAESIRDVKALLSGNRVPLLKDQKSAELSYTDYLHVFLSLTPTDTLTKRSMNLIESDIRLTPGNEAFRLDRCAAAFTVQIDVRSAYGYAYEISRRDSYLREP